MALTRVDTGIQYFPQFAASKALANAQIYIGQPGLDPSVVANQLQAYIVQEDGMMVAVVQPIRTSAGGVPTYNGSSVQVGVVEAEFSIKVLDASGAQIYYMPSNANNPSSVGVPLPNSVGETELKNDSVSAVKLKTSSVTTPKIADKNVTLAKVQDIATGVILGRSSALSGVTEQMTPAQASRLLTGKIQPILATVAGNDMTLTLNPTTIDFRSPTLSSGAVNTRVIDTALTLTIPNGATLGTVAAVSAKFALLAIDNAGTVELAVVNTASGLLLDEAGVISTTLLNTASDSSGVVYSATARSNVPYRIVGFVNNTQATPGVYATAPSVVQGAGGISAISAANFTSTLSGTTTNVLSQNNAQNIPHGLGVRPVVAGYALVLQTVQAGWAIGDEIFRWMDGVSGVADSSIGVGADATNIVVTSGGSTTVAIGNKTTGVSTAVPISEFKVKVYYSRG